MSDTIAADAMPPVVGYDDAVSGEGSEGRLYVHEQHFDWKDIHSINVLDGRTLFI